MTNETFTGLRSITKRLRMLTEPEKKVDPLKKAKDQYLEIALAYVQPMMNDMDYTKLNLDLKPTYEKCTELHSRFVELGVPEDRVRRMFDSWNTYSMIGTATEELKKYWKTKSAIRTVIKRAVQRKTEKIMGEAQALTSYIELYGKDEAFEVMDTFGIRNFGRYAKENLHHQLVAWREGKIPVRNIVVSGYADWNGAHENTEHQLASVLNKEGLFFFEADDGLDLSKIAVASGNRERQNNRDPAIANNVEHFIINAHGNEELIQLGADSMIKTSDYAHDRKRVNDYRRHLGRRFTIVLKSCDTAKKIPNARNIAQTMSVGHNARLQAFDFKTSMVTGITSNGSLIMSTLVLELTKNIKFPLNFMVGKLYVPRQKENVGAAGGT